MLLNSGENFFQFLRPADLADPGGPVKAVANIRLLSRDTCRILVNHLLLGTAHQLGLGRLEGGAAAWSPLAMASSTLRT